MSQETGFLCCFPCLRPRGNSYHLSDIDEAEQSPDLTKNLPDEEKRHETDGDSEFKKSTIPDRQNVEGVHVLVDSNKENLESVDMTKHLGFHDRESLEQVCKQANSSKAETSSDAPKAVEEDVKLETSATSMTVSSGSTLAEDDREAADQLASLAARKAVFKSPLHHATFYLQSFELDTDPPVADNYEPIMSAQDLAAVVSRLESVAVRLESVASAKGQGSAPAPSGGSAPAPSGGSAPSGPDVPYVVAYDDFRNGSLKQFLEISAGFNNEVSEIALKFRSCFDAQRDFLAMASRSKEPAPADLPALLKPMSENISSVTDFAEKNRKSKQWNHLSAVSSGIGAVGWVAVKPTPGPFVKDNQDSSLFYSNKVLKEFKGVDENQVNWCKSLSGVFQELITYIKNYHTTGVSWNAQGSVASVPVSAAAPSAGGPPPPAPPPPPPGSETGPVKSAGGDDRSALFSSLNKGTDVTKGLKKVSDDMKTHKNPGLRQGPAPYKASKPASPVIAPKPGNKAVAPTKPPKTELEGGKKWNVEYHNGNPSIEISDTNMKQVVYIYKCTQSSITVKGKVNSVVVDSCKKVGVVVNDVVSSLEFINCQSVQGQIMGKAPTVSIDKTDGCMVYLSKDSLDSNIVTSKSSEMNILVPQDNGDFTEFPVPEQFRTTWNGNAFTTEMSDI